MDSTSDAVVHTVLDWYKYRNGLGKVTSDLRQAPCVDVCSSVHRT